jgi:ABC-type Na+ transport system ATPase subunit NatA
MKIKSKSREVIMQIKAQKQVMVLQNKAQKVADKLAEEVIVIAKGDQHIQVQAGTAYQLNAKDFDAKKSKAKDTSATI